MTAPHCVCRCCRFIFEKAKELGVRSVVLDGPDSWAQTMVAEGLVEKFVGLDFADAETVFDRCFVAIQAIKKVPLLKLLASHCLTDGGCYRARLVFGSSQAWMRSCSAWCSSKSHQLQICGYP